MSAVEIAWENLRPPDFVSVPPVPSVAYPPVGGDPTDSWWAAQFETHAHTAIGPVNGNKARNLVDVARDAESDRLLLVGYDGTCCKWDTGPNVRFADDPSWSRQWTCPDCNSVLYPATLGAVPIGVSGEHPDRSRLAGDPETVAAHFDAVLRNRAIGRMRGLFEDHPSGRPCSRTMCRKTGDFFKSGYEKRPGPRKQPPYTSPNY